MRTFTIALLAMLPVSALGQVTINDVGGTSTANGLRVVIGNAGQFQVIRQTTGQFYNPGRTPGSTTDTDLMNGIYLAVGDTVIGPKLPLAVPGTGLTQQEWAPVSNTFIPQGQGGLVTTVLRGTVALRQYELTVTWQYRYPAGAVSVGFSLKLPAGHAGPARLYLVGDSYLGSGDRGLSFADVSAANWLSTYRPALNLMQSLRHVDGTAWAGYYVGHFRCLWNGSACPPSRSHSVNDAAVFSNYVEPAEVDNAFGVMWNFGPSPGTYVTRSEFAFTAYQPSLTKALLDDTVKATQVTSLVYRIDNVAGVPSQSNLAFTDTLPDGVTLADAVVTNSCGGTVTGTDLRPLVAGGNAVRLSGGVLFSGSRSCLITVHVQAALPGMYVFERSQLTALSVVENQAVNQTLMVVESVPVVSLDDLGPINAANVTAYPVSGRCQATSGSVTVQVGSVTSTTPCISGRFVTTLSLLAVLDAKAVAVAATQSNTSGTGSDSRSVLKDTMVPAAPILTSPAAGTITNDNTVTFSGTGEVGTTVKVIAGSIELCRTTVPASGRWSCTSTPLSDGTKTVSSTVTDAAGNVSPASAGLSLTVDTQPPVPPQVTNPAPNATVAASVTFAGLAEPFAEVSVFEGASRICRVAASALGQWSCTQMLAEGAHSVTAQQVDTAGNQSPLSGAQPFTVANVPAVSFDGPAPINAASARAVVLSGRCTTGAGPVKLNVGPLTREVPCSGAGRFTVAIDASSVPDDVRVMLMATQTTAAGTGTDTRTIVKDTVAPPAPQFDVGAHSVNTASPTCSGHAEPGATVTVMAATTVLCRAKVTAGGEWSCVAIPLPDGPLEIRATAADEVGNESSPASLSWVVDTQAPAAPSLTMPQDNARVGLDADLEGSGEPGALVTVFEASSPLCSATVDAAGRWTCRVSWTHGTHEVVVRQTDGAGNASSYSAPVTILAHGVPAVRLDALMTINSHNQAAYSVAGACDETAGTVSVTVGSAAADVACVGGKFLATLDVQALPDAPEVKVSASQTSEAGRGLAEAVVSKDATPPAAPVLLWPLADAVLNLTTPALKGLAEPGARVAVSLNGTVVGVSEADAMGQWVVVPTPLAEGRYTFEARATDSAGNEGPSSAPRVWFVDFTSPARPVIRTPAADAVVSRGPTLLVAGSAEVGAQVTLYLDRQLVGSQTVDDSGHFQVELETSALDEGPHQLHADAVDAAGNRSSSEDVEFLLRSADERLAGPSPWNCTATGGASWLMGLVLLLGRRRR